MPEIISRAEAKALGLQRYFTGKPCKHGHVAERHTNSTHCVTCRIAWDTAPSRKEQSREYMRKLRAEDPGKIREIVRKHLAKPGVREKHNASRRAYSQQYSADSTMNVSKSYAAYLLGIKASELTPELHQAKRQQLEIKRLTDELKRELKELTK